MFRGCIDPRSHLILLVVCRGETKIILLVTSEIEKEVHWEERIEGRSVLDRINILFGEFYA